jgi:rhodanese-related sulfurtransferase
MGRRRPHPPFGILAVLAALVVLAGACRTGGEDTAGPAFAAPTSVPIVGAEGASPAGPARPVPPADVAALLAAEPDVVVLDVRTPAEFAAGRLAGARNLDVSDPGFAAGVAALDPAARYVVYCRSGNRSATAVQMMRDAGFTDVVEVAGGITAWVAAGLPLG